MEGVSLTCSRRRHDSRVAGGHLGKGFFFVASYLGLDSESNHVYNGIPCMSSQSQTEVLQCVPCVVGLVPDVQVEIGEEKSCF